jgi:hypothetical protein
MLQAPPPSTETLAAADSHHSVVETQDPPTDIEIEMQELEIEGAEILLSLHQEAETQASVSIPVAVPQEPAKETMTATQEPVISKSQINNTRCPTRKRVSKVSIGGISARIG